MKLIAVDTSTKYLSAALTEDGRLIGERWQFYEKNHSVVLMPLLEELLALSDTDISDISAFCAVTGPGSFTGVRIGVSTVRALAHGSNKPCIGVDTLECMAANLPFEGALVCPMLDARHRQVYTALYRIEKGMPKAVIPPCAIAFDDMLGQLPKDNVYFMGDGALKNKESIEAEGGVVLPDHASMPRAAAAAYIAQSRFEQGNIMGYNELQPLYLRESQAELALKARS